MFVLSHIVEVESIRRKFALFVTFIDIAIIVTHELGQVWLEDLFCIVRVILPLFFRVRLVAFLVSIRRALILDSEAIKAEHPLIHLEFFNIKLAHQLHNLDSLIGKRVCLFLILIDVQVRPIILLDFLRLFEDLDDLSQEMWPQALQDFLEFAGAEANHQDSREEEQRDDEFDFFLLCFETICHFLQQWTQLLIELVLLRRKDEETEPLEVFRLTCHLLFRGDKEATL